MCAGLPLASVLAGCETLGTLELRGGDEQFRFLRNSTAWVLELQTTAMIATESTTVVCDAQGAGKRANAMQ
jgi:hypothetical protein